MYPELVPDLKEFVFSQVRDSCRFWAGRFPGHTIVRCVVVGKVPGIGPGNVMPHDETMMFHVETMKIPDDDSRCRRALTICSAHATVGRSRRPGLGVLQEICHRSGVSMHVRGGMNTEFRGPARPQNPKKGS